MLRFIGVVTMFSVAAGGFLALDYNAARQIAAAADPEAELSIPTYLDDLTGRLAEFARSIDQSGAKRGLQAMLPQPPEGWTVRPAEKEDAQVFLPSERGALEEPARNLIAEVLNPKVRDAGDVAILTYERGEQKVVVKAVFYPHAIFTSPAAAEKRLALQTQEAVYRGLPTMTVRGLDVTEEMLPEGARGRLFMADVGGQIHIRVLAPRRMADDALVKFFETLNVKAMNAAVVHKLGGLGEVPIIVLASALDREARSAYDADRAARAAARLAASREAFEAAQGSVATVAGVATEASEDPAASGSEGVVCQEGAGGVKRCKVGG